jgi:Ca2+-binding EF-hand superfamily protein
MSSSSTKEVVKNFSEESLEDLRKTFRLFDVDNDGKVHKLCHLHCVSKQQQ